MESKTTKSCRHCPGEDYEISIFICRGRQKAHYPKCPDCEFRTTTEEISPIPVKEETKKPPPLRQTNTGSIMVKSEPPSAEIYLDDDNIGVTPAIITQILPGKYKIKIKMDGYDVWSQSVDVKTNKETSLTAVLQGKDGFIVIESQPTKAEIFIDGNAAGVTPETINNMKPGKHLVEIKLDGYEIWSKEIKVEVEEKTSLTAELTTKYGSISLGSEPTKATIFLDGIEISTTPAILRSVPNGTHLVEVRMDGYNIWKKNANVEPGKEIVLTATLQVMTGTASIKSQPKNAKIYLDGKYAGTTPETIPSIIPGTHEIKVKIDDYDVWTETVNIEAGKENAITAVLQRSTGSLMVESDPANAMIFVDGKEIGHTPEIIMSSAKGTHTVEVRMDGYDIWKENVDIEPGTEKSLTAILQLKTGSLNIDSKPSGGIIFLDGKETGTTPENLKGLKPGAHQVEIKMDGYETWSEGVGINADKENKLAAMLQILTGSVSIKSEPENAMIIIGGNEVGNTPANIADIKPGKYLVEVRMEGYENWSESVEVSAGKENHITAVLQQLAGSLNIKSEPKNAMIIVDGNEVGNSPSNIADIKPGKYLVEVRMEGYEGWSESVEVSAGKENHIIAVLQQLAGSVNIESEPANAIIIIDGNEVGNTPSNIADIKPGKYLVEVRMEGYENWSESVEVSAGKENHITAVLQQLAGSLNIKSEPENTMIIVDGNEVGNTPANITDIKPGKHLVEVRMEGYGNWSESVEVSAGKENHITAVLQQLAGSLNIESEPANAIIIVDGNEIGNTPSNIADIKPGKHLVEVRMDGYEGWSESVEVSAGKENHITAVLQQLAGSVNIESEPANAIIIIDGNEVGNTPANIADIKPGKHLVEVRMDGYENWSESVNIDPGMKVALTAVLKTIPGSLCIYSEPSGAVIFIDSREAGTTPLTITDPDQGKHLVEVRMEGYENWSESVDIEHSKEATLTAVLQLKAGTVTIDSTPPGAMILIDGKEVGTTPSIITDPSPGMHNVELRMGGFENWSENVEIAPGKEATLKAVLQLQSGSLTINSVPSDAMVFIDGKAVDTTSLTITDPSPGNHSVEVKMDGYETWRESVNIVPGKPIALTATLQFKPSTVSITSEPSDAVTLIDGKGVGRTPVIITDLSLGTHTVELKMDKFEAWSESVDIKPGKEVILTAALQLKAGSVCIKSNPSNALTFVDGKEIGTTPVIITNSSSGTYLVEIRIDGYETWNESVDIEPGKEITITADLQMKAGSININSNPSEATIHIDGKMIGKTPETMTDLSPGTHLVEVIMDGYEIWSESVDVKGDMENTLTAKLQEITGSIDIKSNPPEATIYLDGEEVGTTPDAIRSIPIGTHEIEVKMEGYAEWKKTLNVKKGKELNLNAVLLSNTGTVSIESDPTDALMFLDGKDVGKTPVSLTNIIIGMHEVELQKNGYVSWKKTIKIKAGRVNALTAKLMEMTGSVNINSKPSNAIVCIDGKEIGNTPAIINDISAGKYLVEVKRDGYEMWSDNVNIDPAKEFAVTAELQMKPGSVSISSEPPNAMIFIDSNEAGTTPEIITDLSFEKHLVEVRMDGYEVWSESINIEPGIELNVTAELQMKAGSVSIKSEPSNAMILIDNKKAGTTPKTLMDINPGEHMVEIRMEGYETWSESVEVRSEKENVIAAVLQETTGSMSIESSPSEAAIFLDDEEVGTTPGTIRSAIGTHVVEVKLEGYAEWKKKLNIKKGKEITLNAVLQPITGTARLESEPTGAMILLDGENVGKTPKTMTGIETGKHEVEVRLDGYDSWLKVIKIKAGKEYVFTAALQRRRGSLMLISNPSNAIIYMDGKKSGKTPNTITELMPGNYTVEVKLDEYQTWSENVDVQPGKETTLKAVLQAKPGSISIKSKPSDAKILIDGNEAGTTPETINDIECGAHTVELMAEGYDVWSVNVDVKANKESYLTAELQEMTGSISIKSDPSNAMVLIDGKKAGATPAIIKDVSQGTHVVNISIDGYNIWSESVEIEAKKETELTAVLQEMTCMVTINSIPTDALILIDGKKVGTTPETISDIKSGTYLVEVRMDGYEDWSDNIEVADKEYTVTAELQEMTGSIDIKSEPSNATILVNGKKIGLTPEIIKNLKPGIHQVEVRVDGFEIWSNSVEVTSEKQSSVTALLKEATGSVSITSTPVKARIYIDGEEVGTTPSTLPSIPIGTHEIEVKIGGHDDWKKSIIIKKEKEMSLNAVLHVNIGSINIESYPENAMINLDGNDVGKAPKRLTDIIVGTHEVEVLLDGYVTWKKTIKVKAEKETSLSADLEKVSDTIEIKADDTMKTPDIAEPITHETPELEVKPEEVEEKTITKPQESKPPSASKKTQPPPGESMKLRSTYDKISNSQIESLPFITINEENNNIIFCHSSINHRYEEKPIGDGDVIIDHTTELMWCQSGSSDYFSLKKANKWLKKTNKNAYAGFNDWRLPTLEEASSLLEFETKDGNFIDPVFDNKQWGTWTGDKSDKGQAWIVTYVNGTISQVQVGTPATFVRPVRSLNI